MRPKTYETKNRKNLCDVKETVQAVRSPCSQWWQCRWRKRENRVGIQKSSRAAVVDYISSCHAVCAVKQFAYSTPPRVNKEVDVVRQLAVSGSFPSDTCSTPTGNLPSRTCLSAVPVWGLLLGRGGGRCPWGRCSTLSSADIYQQLKWVTVSRDV